MDLGTLYLYEYRLKIQFASDTLIEHQSVDWALFGLPAIGLLNSEPVT